MTVNKGLRREEARACPVHTALREEAVRRLLRDGQFSIVQVLEATRFTAMSESIRWDYIVEFIKQDHNLCDLVALSQAYYKPHKREDEFLNPGSYVAYGGATGRAVGYALVTERNRHLVVARLRQRWSALHGTNQRFDRCVNDARQRLGEDALSTLVLEDSSAA